MGIRAREELGPVFPSSLLPFVLLTTRTTRSIERTSRVPAWKPGNERIVPAPLEPNRRQRDPAMANNPTLMDGGVFTTRVHAFEDVGVSFGQVHATQAVAPLKLNRIARHVFLPSHSTTWRMLTGGGSLAELPA